MGWEHWERQAEDWVRWARTPGHDSFWDFGPAFLDTVVPAPGTATLEVGCGEGRVARLLHAKGHRVVAVDASPTLLRHAIEADADPRYVMADMGALPFADAVFDVVVAYNSLMDVEDMPGAVAEASRVLALSGRLCVCVTHPVADAGTFADRSADAPFTLTGSYLEERPFEGTFERAGLRMVFSGRAYPLESYARALEDAGLLIEILREPAVPEEVLRRDPAEARWTRIPNFLWLRAVKA